MNVCVIVLNIVQHFGPTMVVFKCPKNKVDLSLFDLGLSTIQTSLNVRVNRAFYFTNLLFLVSCLFCDSLPAVTVTLAWFTPGKVHFWLKASHCVDSVSHCGYVTSRPYSFVLHPERSLQSSSNAPCTQEIHVSHLKQLMVRCMVSKVWWWGIGTQTDSCTPQSKTFSSFALNVLTIISQ